MKNNTIRFNSIKEARQAGYKIYINHLRRAKYNHQLIPLYIFRRGKTQNDIHSNGGLTNLELVTPDKVSIKVQARCSNKDAFNRKQANFICLGRALKELNNK